MPGSKFYQRIHSWRLRHIAPRNFVLILSLLAGTLGGFAAILLKNAVYLAHLLITQVISIKSFNLLYLILPFIGILLTYLYLKYFVRDNTGHGISRILHSISMSNSIILSLIHAYMCIRDSPGTGS